MTSATGRAASVRGNAVPRLGRSDRTAVEIGQPSALRLDITYKATHNDPIGLL